MLIKVDQIIFMNILIWLAASNSCLGHVHWQALVKCNCFVQLMPDGNKAVTIRNRHNTLAALGHKPTTSM